MSIFSKFQANKLLKEVSTFGIGGPARYYFEATRIEEMQEALIYCRQVSMPFFILGKGSNSLFDDRGFNGLVISNRIQFCHDLDPKVHVGAGYSFSLLGVQTARRGLAGLEFASGIPASVGGAVYMNAGANGGQTFDCLETVEYVHADGTLKTYAKNEIAFSYRFSQFQKLEGAIVSAQFHLHSSKEARQKQLGIVDYRSKTQPYKDKSAGCVFRNPQVGSAGALIESCGLKGIMQGDAQVSLVHANFIVNLGKATAKDVLDLIQRVQETVKEKKNIDLEMEVRIVPFEIQK